MKLADYLRARGESALAFARRSGVPQTTISRHLRGESMPRGKSAAKVIQASKEEPTSDGGTVTLDDMLEACESPSVNAA